MTSPSLCPFCGEDPSVGLCDIECINDACAANPCTVGRTLIEAITAWNTRAPLPVEVELLTDEEVERCVLNLIATPKGKAGTLKDYEERLASEVGRAIIAKNGLKVKEAGHAQ